MLNETEILLKKTPKKKSNVDKVKSAHIGWDMNHNRTFFTNDEQVDNELIEEQDESTQDWAIKVGFTKGQAGIIGKACESVDDYCSTLSPCNIFDQTWHFSDTADNEATENDPRIIHAANCLYYAVCKYKEDKKLTYKCLKILGRGLHPFQDITAHTKDYVYYGLIKWHNFFSCCGPQVDNVKYIDGYGSKKSFFKKEKKAGFNHRYSDLKTTSLWYLATFRNLALEEKVSKEIEERVEDSEKFKISKSKDIIDSLKNAYSSIKGEQEVIRDTMDASCCFPCRII